MANYDPSSAAADLASTWQAVTATLAPVVGVRGATALVQRSFQIAAATHAWLTPAIGSAEQGFDKAMLVAVTARQGGEEARAGAACLKQGLVDLLGSMIGASLAERLLRDAWRASPLDLQEESEHS